MRKTLPDAAYPSLEIEPKGITTEWFSTRAQRTNFRFELTLTVKNSNEDFGVEYISAIANVLCQIITHPSNLQLKVVNSKKYDADIGLVDVYIQDSLIDNVSPSANKTGTIRQIEMDWFAIIHEPYPESAWKYGTLAQPTNIINNVIVP